MTPGAEHDHDAVTAQARIRGLLDAHRAVLADLDLEHLLRSIVECACELVEAPFGALGVLRPGGDGLERFVHAGMDDRDVAAIGRLPEGRGLLGALIEDPRPIRLRDLCTDSRSVGFPDHHPPMRGFLGVPIRVRGEVYGNLYLASLTEGSFSRQDEEVVDALAATAGLAIANARLFAESRRRQQWLTASHEVTRGILDGSGPEALHLVARRAADLAGADLVTVAVPAQEHARLRVKAAVGLGAEQLVGHSYPLAGTASEEVLRTGRPELVADASLLPAGGTPRISVARMVPLGPVMVLPLTGIRGTRGVLVVGRGPGRRPFGPPEIEMASSFAHYASVSLEIADSRRDAQRMALLEDRARIARDLHDHVIQQLFAAGMMLQGVLPDVREEAARDVVERVIDELDDAIGQIRTSIFQLRPRSLTSGGVRSEVLALASEVAPALGWEPRIRFQGPVDTVNDPALTADVVAVAREALSNVARHAHARHAEVGVRVTPDSLQVRVEDDGVGVGAGVRRSGLANLSARAQRRNGALTISPGRQGGVRLEWRVPLGPAGTREGNGDG